MTISARLDRFANQIKPTADHIKEANRQTDYMVEQLNSRVSAEKRFTLEKVLKAGSNAKFTSLRNTDENVFDVDLGAYYSGDGATRDQLDQLLQFTFDQLYDIYRDTKQREDFEVLKSAVRVKFRGGIKLHVDVTPIIRDDSLGIENGGWIPRRDGWRLTSVTCHNAFIRLRTKHSEAEAGPVKFNRMVRLVKWWNNLQGSLAQPSYCCDLTTAAAFEAIGVTQTWQTSIQQFFSFFHRHRFLEPIIFDDYYNPKKITLPSDPIIILDSVNPNNNVAHTWIEVTRRDYLERIETAYEAIMDARSAELDDDEVSAVDAWCRVFGEKFRVLSEPVDGNS